MHFEAIRSRYILLSPSVAQQNISQAYAFAVTACMARVEHWMGTAHPKDRYHHVIEKGDTGQGLVAEFANHGLGGLTIQPKIDPHTKKWFPPFQAADLVAYVYRSAIRRTWEGKVPFDYPPFGKLRKALSVEAKTISERSLFEMCREHPDLFQPRK